MSFGIVSSFSFNILFLTQVFTVFGSIIKFNEYLTDTGSNISIPCLAKGSIIWIKEECNSTKEYLRGPELSIENVQKSDAGVYTCLVSVYDGQVVEDVDMMGNSLDGDSAANELADISTTNYQSNGIDYYEALTIILKVRSVPGPVTRLGIRISTILGVMMWEFPKNHSGGYPVISFTAEVRKYTDLSCENATLWERLDPNNIPANVRYYEVYHLKPNTTYEFRIWANNYLGGGEIAATTATTLDQLSDKELLEIVLKDVKDFDPRIWFYAVSISMSALIILGCTVCLLLLRDHYEELEWRLQQEEDEYDSIELVPNIILNPGYYEPEDPNNPSPPYTRTIIFGEDVLSSSESESDGEQSLSFKRKVSLFFTGDTIKRL